MFTNNSEAINQVYNVAYGESSTLNELFDEIKSNLSKFDSKIADISCIHGPNRKGDIPHSLASIEKARRLLNYKPVFSLKDGLKETVKWYWINN
jgi:UDP-N-acetylglucosamine 4-epimerase